MGFKYRKSLNVGGVRLTAGKNGIGVSAGVKGFRVSHGADGKTRVTASIPGTGISYQETVGGKKKKEKRNKREEIQYDEEPLLCSFAGSINAIHEDGKRVYDEFNKHLYFGKHTFSFYPNTFHMVDPERGESSQYAFAGDIGIKKKTYDSGFWIFKSRVTDLIIEVNGVEYSIRMLSEGEADRVIGWQLNYKEICKEFDEEIAALDAKAETDVLSAFIDDEDPVLIGSCIHCFTRDVIEDWQLNVDDETQTTSIYCKHCTEDFYWEDSLNYESQFYNDKGEYAFNSMTCPNPDCEEQISLVGVPFEEGVAHVTCGNCDAEIDVTPPA